MKLGHGHVEAHADGSITIHNPGVEDLWGEISWPPNPLPLNQFQPAPKEPAMKPFRVTIWTNPTTPVEARVGDVATKGIPPATIICDETVLAPSSNVAMIVAAAKYAAAIQSEDPRSLLSKVTE